MNETQQPNDTSPNFAPLIGFALGAAVGGILALLLAPASGQKTRRRIGETARRMSRDARHTYEEARDTVSEVATGLGADVKSALDAGREAFEHDGSPVTPRPLSRIAPMINPTPPRTP